MHPLSDLVQQNRHQNFGVFSCCSADEDVIRAVFKRMQDNELPILIESTSNQVNQYRGYSGKTPAEFAQTVLALANEFGIDNERVIIGGDHLGPLPWVDRCAEEALREAEKLVSDCILAGYSKIHLDTSMRLDDDSPDKAFPTRLCAERGARLCQAAEAAFQIYRESHPTANKPLYVIGSEVPTPGGDSSSVRMGISSPQDALKTIEIYESAFQQANLHDAFRRVIALVTELGVEFHDSSLDEYDHERCQKLTAAMKTTTLCVEGHSSDYQTAAKLKEMCEDGVAILKVGPAFTFALREALYALEAIERELYAGSDFAASNFREALEEVMLEHPEHWQSYYIGSSTDTHLSRSFSFFDRCRYYFQDERMLFARDRLFENLSHKTIPLSLLSQYLPVQYQKVRAGLLKNEAYELMLDHIGSYIDTYLEAVTGGKK